MKIVVIGGAGVVGAQVVRVLKSSRHEVVAASPRTGVDAATGEGLAQVLAGADVVIDVSNSPTFADEPVLTFFESTTRNLLAAGASAGVKHFVALSIVGTEKLQGSGYFRAKLRQEELVEQGPLPYSIVRSTQFHEFIGSLAAWSVQGDVARVAPLEVQPVAAADAAITIAAIALGAPLRGRVEVGGPEVLSLPRIIEQTLRAQGDQRAVISDPSLGFFGAAFDERALITGADAHLGTQRYAEFLSA